MLDIITVTLEDVCTKVTDGTHDSPKLQNSGVPFIKAKHITTGIVDFDNCDFITQTEHEKVIARSKPEYNDILFTNIGASLGRSAIIKSKMEFSIKNVALFKPDKETIDPDYLFFKVNSIEFQEGINNYKSGSAQPFVSLGSLREFKFDILKDLTKQKHVAEVLINYDNLIENNNRRIAILEDMAQSLYREWFVNFRYPNHEDNLDADGNPKLIDSSLGQIPEDWSVDVLKNFCSKIGSGATPRGGKGAYKKEGIPLIRSMNIYDSTLITKDLAFIDDEQATRLKNVIVEPNDVLLNITGASVARCSIVPSAYTPARVNQHVAIIRLNTDILSAEFLLYTLISKNGKARLLSTAQGGATREALTKSDIEKFKVVVPPNDIIKRFNLLVQDAVKQKEVLFLKNENLKKQRDMLLPKLISGQIELKD